MRGDTTIKAVFAQEDFANAFRLLFIKEVDGSITHVLVGDEWKEYEPFTLPPRTSSLNLDRRMMTALVHSVLEWAGQNNMRTEPEEHLKGKLDATSYHLEDLRKLLKLT